MEVSIIISTHNRAKRLRGLFADLVGLRIPPEVEWELFVVDNASTDETPELLRLEVKRSRLPIVPLIESIPGKSRALNLALSKASGGIIVFLDDDVKPSEGWLNAYWEAATECKDYDGFGGRIVACWEGEPPSWLMKRINDTVFWPLINHCDLGEVRMPFPRGMSPGGLNCALRRSAVQKMGRFREDLGPGTDTPFAEDTEYMRRLLRLGGRFLYVPDATVRHLNPAERMTRQYILRWCYDVERSQAIAFGDATGAPTWGQVPRYVWRRAVQRFIGWCLEARPSYRFEKKMKWMRVKGQIAGHKSRLAM